MRVGYDTLFSSEVVNNETTVSESVSLEHIYGYAVYASWTGSTISGSIKLECSVDGTNWADVTSSEQTITGASSFLWNEPDAMYKWFRVSATSNDANDITVTAVFCTKGA